MNEILIKPITKTRNILYSKCGHRQETKFILSTENEYENYLDLMHDGRNDFCDNCKKVNAEYGMIRIINTGDYDTRITHYTFNHANIKQVVKYFRLHDMSLHDEHYNINLTYDCTGKCFVRYCKVKKFKKHITVKFSYHYDL